MSLVSEYLSNGSDWKTTTHSQFPFEMCKYMDNMTRIPGCVNANGVDGQGPNTIVTYPSDDSEQSQLSGMQVVLLIYIFPVVICLGIIGNAITLYVIQSTPLKKYSVCVYMSAYCISNILSLTLNTGLEWFLLMFEQLHFQHYSDPICRLWQFFIRIISHSGAWFVVAITIDRYITTWHPHRQQEMCTKFIAKLVICIIMVGLVCVSVHALWTYTVTYSTDWNRDMCVFTDNEENRHCAICLVWFWTSFMCYYFLPISLLFIFGNLVCVRLCLRKTTKDEEKSAEITHASVIICCFYFFLSAPVIVIDLILNTLNSNDQMVFVRLQTCRQVAHVMFCVGYTTNFPVLCVCCQQFRIFLVRKLTCCDNKELRMECTAV